MDISLLDPLAARGIDAADAARALHRFAASPRDEAPVAAAPGEAERSGPRLRTGLVDWFLAGACALPRRSPSGMLECSESTLSDFEFFTAAAAAGEQGAHVGSSNAQPSDTAPTGVGSREGGGRTDGAPSAGAGGTAGTANALSFGDAAERARFAFRELAGGLPAFDPLDEATGRSGSGDDQAGSSGVQPGGTGSDLMLLSGGGTGDAIANQRIADSLIRTSESSVEETLLSLDAPASPDESGEDREEEYPSAPPDETVVRLVNVAEVPEPSTLLLLATGVGATLARRRRTASAS